MQEIILQVGALLLGSVPTLILFVFLVIAYQFLVQTPLTKMLAERRARTLGAVEAAQKSITAAEVRAAEYAEQLRLARTEVFRTRELKMQEWAADREAAIAVARARAAEQVHKAHAALTTEVVVARQSLLASADELAMQVVRAILPQGTEQTTGQATGGIR